ncbi:hypothetical protein CISIN_1g0406022mg, partial [Citrus sinensis]
LIPLPHWDRLFVAVFLHLLSEMTETLMNSMRFLLNLHYKSVFMKSLPSLLWRSVMVGVVVNVLTPFFNPTIYASLSLFVDMALFF